MARKKQAKKEVAPSVPVLAPTLKGAEKVAPRDYATDPAWLRFLINEFLDVLPEEIPFREDADPERCAQLLGFIQHVNAADGPRSKIGSDEEE